MATMDSIYQILETAAVSFPKSHVKVAVLLESINSKSGINPLSFLKLSNNQLNFANQWSVDLWSRQCLYRYCSVTAKPTNPFTYDNYLNVIK